MTGEKGIVRSEDATPGHEPASSRPRWIAPAAFSARLLQRSSSGVTAMPNGSGPTVGMAATVILVFRSITTTTPDAPCPPAGIDRYARLPSELIAMSLAELTVSTNGAAAKG